MEDKSECLELCGCYETVFDEHESRPSWNSHYYATARLFEDLVTEEYNGDYFTIGIAILMLILAISTVYILFKKSRKDTIVGTEE